MISRTQAELDALVTEARATALTVVVAAVESEEPRPLRVLRWPITLWRRGIWGRLRQGVLS